MIIKEVITRFRNIEVEVELDSLLLPTLDCQDKTSTTRRVSVNLYRLIYAIGTIQSRRFAPSNRQKFSDKADLVDKIHGGSNELRIRLNDIRLNLGSEALKSISEDFGAGLSVLIAEELYNIKYSTIQRIHGTKKRPDWKCQTRDNRLLVVESKGSSSRATSNAQQTNALVQKTSRSGDVRIASLSVLNEHTISSSRFIDPPTNPDTIHPDERRNILRAGHYSSVFSFLGNSELSRYYGQMRKRLLRSITNEEQITKNDMYRRLRDDYPTVNFANFGFSGKFYHVVGDQFLFIGVDRRLLSYEGFINFLDYPKAQQSESQNNYFVMFEDGVLIIEIKNVEAFSDIVDKDQIPSYQENITISDVDGMTEQTFEKYINHVLVSNGFETQIQYRMGRFIADILATKNGKQYLVELKISQKKELDSRWIEKVLKLGIANAMDKTILITNSHVPFGFEQLDNSVVLIGREQLRQILKRPTQLNKYM